MLIKHTQRGRSKLKKENKGYSTTDWVYTVREECTSTQTTSKYNEISVEWPS